MGPAAACTDACRLKQMSSTTQNHKKSNRPGERTWTCWQPRCCFSLGFIMPWGFAQFLNESLLTASEFAATSDDEHDTEGVPNDLLPVVLGSAINVILLHSVQLCICISDSSSEVPQ
jgi:hypothetical protein